MVKTKTNYSILFVALVILGLLITPAVSAFTVELNPEVTTINLNIATGQSLIYQDPANNRYVNWTVLTGTLTGTATISIDSVTGGTFTVTPSSTCTVSMTTINAYIAVGSIYQTTYTYTYTTGSAKTVTWIFQLPTPTPTPTPLVQYALIIQTDGQGTTNPLSNIYFFYNTGTTVTLTATPASGWAFDYWLLNDGTTQTTPVITLTMYTNKSALAVFKQIPTPGEPTPTPTIAPTPIPTPNINYPNRIDSSGLTQYLSHWDFFGFVVGAWAASLTLPGFYIVMALIVSIAVYLQMKSLIILISLWIVLGTFIIVFVPEIAPVCYFFYAISFGGILYKVLGQTKDV